MRKAIIGRNIQDARAGKMRGGELSFAVAFERLYGEPLIKQERAA